VRLGKHAVVAPRERGPISTDRTPPERTVVRSVGASEVLALQQAVGNAAVARVLGSRHLQARSPVVQRDVGWARRGPFPDPYGEGLNRLRVAGKTDSKKIVRVGWSFDDGPDEFAAAMEAKLRPKDSIGGRILGTWFVMRDKMEKIGWDKAVALLKRKQDEGHEIAIHSMDPDKDRKGRSHVRWFPRKPSTDPSKPVFWYETVEAALADLKTFRDDLEKAGIKVRFVRLPTGLHTELMNYLEKLGVPNADRVAHDIFDGKPVPADAKPVVDAYATLKSGLEKLGLSAWGGGKAKEPDIVGWEAESAPAGSGLADNVRAKFKGVVNLAAADGKPHSLLILAHDTSSASAEKVGADIVEMEAYAEKMGVRVEYEPMGRLHDILYPPAK
jgi:Polysaccharide deacetylase